MRKTDPQMFWYLQRRFGPLSLVSCYPIGVVRMFDGEEADDKIIAIPFQDPTWNFYRELKDLPPHIAAEIEHFFQVYKTLERRETAGFEIHGREVALKIVTDAIELYKKTFPEK